MPELFNKILLPVSGSEESMKAADFAINLAKTHGSQIVALHVIDTSVVRQLARHSGKSPGEIEVEMEENGWHYLYHVEEMAKDNKVKIVVLLDYGLPQEGILTKERELGVDLIIFGQSRGRGTRGRFIEKSLHQVLENSISPVLVIK